MKYLAALLLLFPPLAMADRCVDKDGGFYDCFGDGSASHPSLTLGNERTGLFSSGNGDLRFAVLGVEVARFDVKDGWVVPVTNSHGLYISDDEVARPWAINSTSKAVSQITGGLSNTPIGQTTPSPGKFTVLNATVLELNSKVLVSPTVPTIKSGFGGLPSVKYSNGSASFAILVGSSDESSTGEIAMPAAPHGWACSASDVTTSSNVPQQTGSSPSSVTLTNYVRTTGLEGSWTQRDVIEMLCLPN